MILERYREEIWQEYTASALNMIGSMFAKKWPLPAFHELIDFDARRRKNDARSSGEIMTDLIGKLGGG